VKWGDTALRLALRLAGTILMACDDELYKTIWSDARRIGCQSVYDSIGSREGGDMERDSCLESGERAFEAVRGTRAAVDEAGEIVDVEDALAILGRRVFGEIDWSADIEMK
jgi:hypothetical protein